MRVKWPMGRLETTSDCHQDPPTQNRNRIKGRPISKAKKAIRNRSKGSLLLSLPVGVAEVSGGLGGLFSGMFFSMGVPLNGSWRWMKALEPSRSQTRFKVQGPGRRMTRTNRSLFALVTQTLFSVAVRGDLGWRPQRCDPGVGQMDRRRQA